MERKLIIILDCFKKEEVVSIVSKITVQEDEQKTKELKESIGEEKYKTFSQIDAIIEAMGEERRSEDPEDFDSFDTFVAHVIENEEIKTYREEEIFEQAKKKALMSAAINLMSFFN